MLFIIVLILLLGYLNVGVVLGMWLVKYTRDKKLVTDLNWTTKITFYIFVFFGSLVAWPWVVTYKVRGTLR